MNETEIKSDANQEAAVRELKEQVQSLRSFVLTVVMLVILLSGAVNLFLLRQASMVNAQLVLQLRQIEEDKVAIADFNNRIAPLAVNLWGAVTEFSKTNRDILPLLSKYNFVSGPTAAPTAPATPKK